MACDKEFKPLETDIKTIEESFSARIQVTYETFKGGSTADDMNAAMEKAMIASVSDAPDAPKAKSLEAALKNFDEEYKSFITDFPDSNQQWELNIESEVIYQSEDVITVAINTYQDKGGAHGNDSITLLNFDPDSGKVLEVGDYITNRSGFKALAEDYFFKAVKRTIESDDAEDYFFGDGFQLPNNIGFSEEGVILLYNVYEIASYAQGYTEFTIPYEEANAFLNF